MKLKPRFHILFFIYIFFGAVIFGLLCYIFAFKIGENTEINYKKVFENEINDTINNIGILSGKDYAYMHGGLIKTVELKHNKEIEFALYLESYENIDNIKVGDIILKERFSEKISIKSVEKNFEIKLRNIERMRNEKRQTEIFKWIFGYLIMGLVILFVPINISKNKHDM